MRISRIILGSLLISVLAACTNQSIQVVNDKPLTIIKQTKEINMIGHWYGEGDRQRFVEDIVRDYEFKHQDVKINLSYPHEVYFDKENRGSLSDFVSEVCRSGETKWDVVMLNGEYEQVSGKLNDKSWSNKYLVDFNEIDEFHSGTIDEMLTKKNLDKWNGIAPGPYVEGQYWALWTNKSVAQKLGIDIKQFDVTPEYLLDCIKRVYEHNQSNPDDYIAPIFESYSWQTFDIVAYMLFLSKLDDYAEFSEDSFTRKRLNAWHETLKVIEQMSKFNPLFKDWKTTEWTESQHVMTDGKCLFYINGSWMYNIWKSIDEEKVLDCVPCELPGFKDHVVYPASFQTTWGVPKAATNKDQAVDFLLDLNKPDIAEMWSRYTKCPTGIKGNLSSANFGGDQYESFANYVTSNFKGRMFSYYSGPVWVIGKSAGWANLRIPEVLRGELSADEAIRLLKKEKGFS